MLQGDWQQPCHDVVPETQREPHSPGKAPLSHTHCSLQHLCVLGTVWQDSAASRGDGAPGVSVQGGSP